MDTYMILYGYIHDFVLFIFPWAWCKRWQQAPNLHPFIIFTTAAFILSGKGFFCNLNKSIISVRPNVLAQFSVIGLIGFDLLKYFASNDVFTKLFRCHVHHPFTYMYCSRPFCSHGCDCEGCSSSSSTNGLNVSL